MIYFDKNKCVDKLLISCKKKAVTITGNSLCLYRINTPCPSGILPKGGNGASKLHPRQLLLQCLFSSPL